MLDDEHYDDIVICARNAWIRNSSTGVTQYRKINFYCIREMCIFCVMRTEVSEVQPGYDTEFAHRGPLMHVHEAGTTQ
jgi:hypothetical protein